MRLPNLNALRAFEAAARHGGFIAAAEELHVTRGAVSRHIKLLEQDIGVQLFRRTHAGVELTQAGARMQPVLAEAFARIATEAGRLAAEAAELRIICPPALSIRWLFPRLDAFRQRHPEIRVRLTTDFYGDRGFDLVEHDLGLSIEHRPGRSTEIEVAPLFPMVLCPACAPGLSNALSVPDDIARVPLLHESRNRDDWALWAETFGLHGLDTDRGEVFPNFDMAVRAAVMGAGLVMADLVLCRDEFERGALVLPFPQMARETRHGRYALIGPRERWHDPKVAAFRAWAEEIAATDAAGAIPETVLIQPAPG